MIVVLPRASPDRSVRRCQSLGFIRRSKNDDSHYFHLSLLALAALCFSLPATAADLPKSGKYSGHYGWTSTGQVQKLGEDRVIYAGVVPGVMFDDKGKGFMRTTLVG